MGTINIGKVRQSFEGTYSASTAYTVLDTVFFSGESYVCIQATTAGTAPTNTTHWQKIAAKGADGTDGADGSDGATGATGPQGTTGAVGPTGSQGPAGNDGATGAQGAAGAAGPTGPQGLTGPTGAQGADGNDGATGATGPQGAVGPQGNVGPQGPAGDDGADASLTASSLNAAGVFHNGNVPSSGDWWNNKATPVQTNGVMEIGRYIDFHSTDTTTADYTYRIDNYSADNLSFYGNVNIDNGQNTTLTLNSDDNGKSTINLYGGSQGTGMVYVGQSSSYGGGIEYNGDNSPATSGAGADQIALFRRNSNTVSWTARNSVSNNDWQFRGNVTAYASDERLKDNVTTIDNALDKVSQLRGVTYDWKDDVEEKGFLPSMKHETGVIAQEVQKVIPDAVVPAPFDNEYLTVQHEKIIPVLIEAIKELKAEVAQLKGGS